MQIGESGIFHNKYFVQWYLDVVLSRGRSRKINKRRSRIRRMVRSGRSQKRSGRNRSSRANDRRTRSRSVVRSVRSWKEAEGDQKEEKFHIIYIKEWEHGNITSKALWEFHRILSNHSPHNTTLNCTKLHYTILHYTTHHTTALHCTKLNYTEINCTTLHYTALHYITLHYIPLHYPA